MGIVYQKAGLSPCCIVSPDGQSGLAVENDAGIV